jgi:hypothetical protein
MDARIALAGVPLLLMLAAAQFGMLPGAEEEARRPQARPSSPRVGAGQRPAVPAVLEPVRIERATVNSVFRSGPDGRLRLDAGAKDRLLVLLDQEERDHEPVAAREVTLHGLAPDQARQALAWLEAMRSMRAEEAALFTRPGRGEGVAAALQLHEEVVALRRRHFGADADAMFAAEEERTRRHLEALRGAVTHGGD